MAGPASNFTAEIKKGMSGPKAKSSDGGVPTKDAKKDGAFNGKPKAGPKNVGDTQQAATGTTGAPDTFANMQAAGQAHMDAIHAHIRGLG